jgi:hypothetical protein
MPRLAPVLVFYGAAQVSLMAACVPEFLVPTFIGGQPDNSASHAAWSVPVKVQVRDNCGNLVPAKPKGVPATVSLHLPSGPKQLVLTDEANAGYTPKGVLPLNADLYWKMSVTAKLGSLTTRPADEDRRPEINESRMRCSGDPTRHSRRAR